MMDTATQAALPEPKLSDEVTGELMCIQENLDGLAATFQLVLDGFTMGSKDGQIFKACAEGSSFNFLLTSLFAIKKELHEFMERHCDPEAQATP